MICISFCLKIFIIESYNCYFFQELFSDNYYENADEDESKPVFSGDSEETSDEVIAFCKT